MHLGSIYLIVKDFKRSIAFYRKRINYNLKAYTNDGIGLLNIRLYCREQSVKKEWRG